MGRLLFEKSLKHLYIIEWMNEQARSCKSIDAVIIIILLRLKRLSRCFRRTRPRRLQTKSRRRTRTTKCYWTTKIKNETLLERLAVNIHKFNRCVNVHRENLFGSRAVVVLKKYFKIFVYDLFQFSVRLDWGSWRFCEI